MADLSVYGKLKTLADYQDANKQSNFEAQLLQQKAMSGGGGDPAALRLANEYLAAKESGDIERANAIEAFAKTREKNVMLTPDGSYVPLAGMPQALGQLEYGQQRGGMQGKKDVELNMNPLIEYRTTVAGDEGELVNKRQLAAEQAFGAEAPKTQARDRAKAKVTGNLNAMAQAYQELQARKASVDVNEGVLSNIYARTRASQVGQAIGTALGTEEQSIRNEIQSLRPTLVNDIRQASEMGAKGMDSEKELEFFLQAATDPRRDVQSNMAALAVLDRAYGLGAKMQADPAAVDALRREFMTRTGQRKGNLYDKGEQEFNNRKMERQGVVPASEYFK